MSWFATWSGSPTIGKPPIPWAYPVRICRNFSSGVFCAVMFLSARMSSRLLLARPAGDNADGIDAELPALLPSLLFSGGDLLRGLVERRARSLQEKRVAVADCEGLPDRGGAGIHDHRP